MGFLKAVFLIVTPIAGLTVMAFRLGNKLPTAARLFGNNIGLAYVYFKVILKWVKPVDHMPLQMISLARKTSQQSQALRRELKATMKRVRDEVNAKKNATFQELGDKVHNQQAKTAIDELIGSQQNASSKHEPYVSQSNSEKVQPNTGSQLILNILQTRQELYLTKTQKKQSRKFFDEL